MNLRKLQQKNSEALTAQQRDSDAAWAEAWQKLKKDVEGLGKLAASVDGGDIGESGSAMASLMSAIEMMRERGRKVQESLIKTLAEAHARYSMSCSLMRAEVEEELERLLPLAATELGKAKGLRFADAVRRLDSHHVYQIHNGEANSQYEECASLKRAVAFPAKPAYPNTWEDICVKGGAYEILRRVVELREARKKALKAAEAVGVK